MKDILACKFCGVRKEGMMNSDSPYVTMRGIVRQRVACRDCNTARLREYREKNRDRINAIGGKSMRLHRDRQSARASLLRAVRSGRIERPKSCPRCGKECTVEGHHTDYSKPLDVMWLCRQCHADQARREKASAITDNLL